MSLESINQRIAELQVSLQHTKEHEVTLFQVQIASSINPSQKESVSSVHQTTAFSAEIDQLASQLQEATESIRYGAIISDPTVDVVTLGAVIDALRAVCEACLTFSGSCKLLILMLWNRFKSISSRAMNKST